MRTLLLPVLVAVFLAIGASAAQAGAFVLTLTDGLNTVTINDNQIGDTKLALDQIGGTNVTVGSFTVSSILGAMFYGINAPVQMSITNFRVSSTAAGKLTATLSRQDLSGASLNLGPAVMGLGSANMSTGFGVGTVAFTSYVDPNNGSVGTQVFNSAMPGGALQGAPTHVDLGQGNFSLLTQLEFTFTEGGVVGGSSGLQVLNNPEPMTLLLLGPGMVGLSILRRRRAKAR